MITGEPNLLRGNRVFFIPQSPRENDNGERQIRAEIS